MGEVSPYLRLLSLFVYGKWYHLLDRLS